MSDQYYGGAIWTNHALDRLRERGLSQDDASQAFNAPDKIAKGSEAGTTLSQKWFGKSTVSIISKQNEKGEWIILSCWVDPPLPGTEDEKRKQAYKAYQKSSTGKKIWVTIKRQLGLSKY